MKKLTNYQQSKITDRIRVSQNREIVVLNVSSDRNLSLEENNRNIYMIDREQNIIWQIKGESHYTEVLKKQYPEDISRQKDMFTSISKNDKGEIIARRFSGFSYKVFIETGETKEVSWSK